MIVPNEYLFVRGNSHIARVNAHETRFNVRVFSCKTKQ